MFVVCDLGRPDRFWHLMPGLGRFNWPMSMLTWDVIVLNGYLLLNLHICGYLLYMRFLGRKPNPAGTCPSSFFRSSGRSRSTPSRRFSTAAWVGRPFWNTALLAPRFLASAFVSGPAFIIIAIQVIRRAVGGNFGAGPIRTLVNIIRVTILINLLMVISEVFVAFYTGGSHAASALYLFFGLHGHNALVPWVWASIGMTVIAALVFLCPKVYDHPTMMNIGCGLAFVGIWIEKGMGMVIPGFVPSVLHEMVEYTPSLLEWKITAGIWALGLMIYTLALKIAINILRQSSFAAKPHAAVLHPQTHTT
jgi:Ni/Fe-hydrogenase subunit HybB-like protein